MFALNLQFCWRRFFSSFPWKHSNFPIRFYGNTLPPPPPLFFFFFFCCCCCRLNTMVYVVNLCIVCAVTSFGVQRHEVFIILWRILEYNVMRCLLYCIGRSGTFRMWNFTSSGMRRRCLWPFTSALFASSAPCVNTNRKSEFVKIRERKTNIPLLTRVDGFLCDLTVHSHFVYMYTYMSWDDNESFWTVLRIYNIIIMAYMKTTLRGLFTLIMWCVPLLTSRFKWTRMFTERIWRMKVILFIYLFFYFLLCTLTKLEINMVMSTCL